MTLEDLAALSQIVGVFAVFASLIFVGVQVRQNSALIRANTHSIKASAAFEGTHSWASTNEMIVADLPDETLLAAVASYDPEKTWNDFSEADRTRITLIQRALYQKLEGLYFLHKYGSLDSAIWEARLSWAAGTVKLPFYRQWWEFEKTQAIWSAEFVAVVEAARDTTTVVPWQGMAYQKDSAAASKAER